MKLPQTLNTRLVLSHLLVSIVSIVLMAAFAGRSIYNAAIAEAEHTLQDLAFAAGNAGSEFQNKYDSGTSRQR